MLNKEYFITLKNKIKSSGKLKWIIISVLLILLIILFINQNNFTKKTDTEVDSVSTYVLNLENKLNDIVSKIDGVGKSKVMLSIESGMETVLATKKTEKQTQNGKETEESPILINGKTVVVKEMYPKIIGAVIVCEGAKNISVINSILNATTSLLNIDKENVQIIKMK